MSYTFHAQGIVLNKRDFTEYGNLYTIYTKEYGKINAYCKGSKKIQSKLGPYLENRDILNLFFAQGRSQIILIGVNSYERFPFLFLEYKKILFSSYCVELVDQLMKNNDKDEYVFDILKESLKQIETQSENYDLIMHYFTLKMLVAIGFTPQLYLCLNCNCDIMPNGNVFSIQDGGLFCENCSSKNKLQNKIDISNNTIKLLRMAINNNLVTLFKLGLDITIKSQFAFIVQKYFTYHTDKNIKSLKLFI